MDAITITRVENDTKGLYVANVEGHDEVGELSYSRAGPTLVIVDHTGVPDSLRGRGLGTLLAERVVADARADGFRIVPLCPFFKAQAMRHPEWGDVVQ